MEENSQKIINKAKTLKQENDTRLLRTVEIKKYKDNVGEESMELMEMTIGDFRIYSHRPGGIKVRRISDGQQLLVISDNLKVTYYGDSEDIIEQIQKKFDVDYSNFNNLSKNWLPMQEYLNLTASKIFVKTHNAMCTINGNPFIE